MNKYEVLGVIGEGAYGVVLKSRLRETGELVAIKKFKETEDIDSMRKTSIREVKILRLLRHDNVVHMREAFRRQGKLYLVFEYMEKNLLEVLEEHPNGLPFDLVRSCIFQLCKAIDYMHQHNVLHRDIKPENLLVSSSNSLKICDFGFSRTLPSKAGPLTDYVATRWYRSPELLVGTSFYGKEVDMWAIACIMGELTDGQPLFPGESEIDQLYVIQKVLGTLPDSLMEAFHKNPRFIGLKFPEIKRVETLELKYKGKMNKQALNFMHSLLNMDPAERMTAAEALMHPYFDGLRETNRSRVSMSNVPKSKVKVSDFELRKHRTESPPHKEGLRQLGKFRGDEMVNMKKRSEGRFATFEEEARAKTNSKHKQRKGFMLSDGFFEHSTHKSVNKVKKVHEQDPEPEGQFRHLPKLYSNRKNIPKHNGPDFGGGPIGDDIHNYMRHTKFYESHIKR